MKLSVSLPGEDVEYLDAYARDHQLGSRSAVLHKAVRLLRAAELGADYKSAWEEWEASGDAEAWERTADDGLTR
jgi:Arc/MetJ-type ribon-helix-helix transcriptional regulator